MDTNIKSKKQSNFMKISIIVAIVIIMNMFFNYGVSLVYKEPVMSNFIKDKQIIKKIDSQKECISIGGQWNENIYPNPIEKNIIQKKGYCNENYTNRLNYEKSKVLYEKNVFVTLIILGIASLVLASFLSIQILSISFAWGGVLSLIIASMRYWSKADNLVKVIILALALSMLIWLAIKKFNK